MLLSPKMPSSVGSVARAASSFECQDLRLVAPRCNPLARSARNSSKGAQVSRQGRAGLAELAGPGAKRAQHPTPFHSS